VDFSSCRHADRLRQAVCGYDQTRVKICCSIDDYPTDQSTYINVNDSDASYSMRPSLDVQCGKSLIRDNVSTVGSYPFVARIGFKSKYLRLCGNVCAMSGTSYMISAGYLKIRSSHLNGMTC